MDLDLDPGGQKTCGSGIRIRIRIRIRNTAILPPFCLALLPSSPPPPPASLVTSSHPKEKKKGVVFWQNSGHESVQVPVATSEEVSHCKERKRAEIGSNETAEVLSHLTEEIRKCKNMAFTHPAHGKRVLPIGPLSASSSLPVDQQERTICSRNSCRRQPDKTGGGYEHLTCPSFAVVNIY
jgi:hypothetical protein